jgi:hypothetical protein
MTALHKTWGGVVIGWAAWQRLKRHEVTGNEPLAEAVKREFAHLQPMSEPHVSTAKQAVLCRSSGGFSRVDLRGRPSGT